MELVPKQQQQLGQYLTITQSLKLSLEVLQLPLAQLQVFLSQHLEENPVLEAAEPVHEGAEPARERPVENYSQGLDDNFSDPWRHADGSFALRNHEDDPQPLDSPAKPPSFFEHLLTQLASSEVNGSIRTSAQTLLGWLDTDGYLRSTLEEIAQAEGLALEDLQKALALIQRFDPTGVGARTLQECLLLQLTDHQEADGLAALIVREHFALLAKRKFPLLAVRLRVSLPEVQAACQRIAQLDPKPARSFTHEPVVNLVPDLIVYKEHGEFQVELNEESLPRMSLSARYRGLMRHPSTAPEVKEFLREKVRRGVWLLKAVHQRKQTLLALGRCLVELERDYLLHGVSHLKALTQEEVARLVGCHASTVSRAIAGKTIQTPDGILLLETFFGGGIAHPEGNGSALSPKTIRAELTHLITQENTARPLSDQALAEGLRERGYPVARRTVAKYRTQLKILPAHLRRHAS